ncbi:MAG: hypothetical protein FWC57_04430, partial [Endomicrobia bacterium]|nr:hypothetical protein [Endomicrobiia bacterium]
EDGTLSVLDPNKNNGKALTYSGEEFKKLMSGVTATTTNGQNVQGYAKVTDANGQMKVITDSKGVAERGIKIGITDMKNIRGAKNTVVGKIGKGIGNAAKWAWKGVKNAAKWCWKELGKVPGLSEYINVWATAIGAIAGLFKGLWQEIKGQEKRIEGERYDKVLDELEKQTGMTRDELQGALDGLDNNTFNRAIKVLEDLFSAGGSIISCVVESMSATLGITNKGLLAFQSFLIDISTRPHGSFVDNAGYVDKDGVYVPWKMLNTTFNAAKKVLQSYGIDARIVSISLDDFMASLKPGESAIVDVKVKNDNNNKTNHHAIKISKEIDEETGKEVFIVTDNLENEGKPVVYTPEGLKTLLSGGKAVDKDGNDVDTGHYGAYSANSVEFGKLEVLTSSQGVIKAGKESIEQSFTESMEIGIKGGKSIASGIGQFFDWVGGLFGRGSKKSPYDKAKANLEAAQRDALNAALPISSNGQPYSEDRLKKAYEALDKAEAAFLAACKTDKERTDAGILIEESRIKIESAALTTLARYYDSGTQKANKAFDDFMAGNITIGQYAQIVSGVNEGRGNILNKAKALSARIDALNDKKRAAGYEVSEADVKESKKIIENIICAQQDYVVSAIENSFMSPKGKEILIGQKELEGQSGLQGQGNGSSNYFISSGEIARYVNSLAALAVVTEELNKMYDKVYGNTPEGAAAKKQRNEYVVSKIEEKQSGMNKYFIETVSATIDRIKAYDPTQAVVNAKDNKTSLDKYKETLQDIAKEGDDVLNAMLKLAESFSGDLADRIRDTGYTAKLASIGITVDSGTITQKGVDENGNVIEREMKYKDTGIDAEIRKIIAVSGWDAAVEFLSSKNLLEENVADTGTSSAQGAEKVQDSGINKNTKAQSAGETAGRLDGVAPEAISASGEETVFNDAKSKATKIADKMNLSGEDKKAIGNAKNIDELETAIGNIKEKGILFKALLLSVTNKEENKGKGFMLSKGKELVLAQAKGEMLKAIDGKGVKGVGARLVAALGFSSMSLTAKERALIAKAGSIQELKAIANKYANMKGLFGKTIGKAIAAKLNAVIAKAESAENAESGEKKDAEAGNKSGDEYDPAMVQAIMDQTGVSRDEAIASLDKAKEEAKKVDAEKGLPEGTTFNQEMALLKDYLAKGGSILNCASSALFTDLGGAVSEGLLALQALSVELATGNLTSESVQGGQLSTSMNAMNEVLHSYGKDSAGYAVNAKDLAGSLKAGDKAILWVDGNHYVTVMKNEDGTMSVIDPNKNNGKALTYSTGEFNKLISGGTAKTTDGQSVAGYTKVADQNGQVKVITDSKAISTAGTKMSVTDMKNVRGAKNTVVGKIGKGIGNAA